MLHLRRCSWTGRNRIRSETRLLSQRNSQCKTHTDIMCYHFFRKEFATDYAQQLLNYNSQYLELKDTKDQIVRTVEHLESQKYHKNRQYHLINPNAEESILQLSLGNIQGLEGQPKVKLYLYIDENYMYKTRTMPPSNNPNINLEIDM